MGHSQMKFLKWTLVRKVLNRLKKLLNKNKFVSLNKITTFFMSLIDIKSIRLSFTIHTHTYMMVIFLIIIIKRITILIFCHLSTQYFTTIINSLCIFTFTYWFKRYKWAIFFMILIDWIFIKSKVKFSLFYFDFNLYFFCFLLTLFIF